MSSPLNLGLVGAAFATIGGMVYGGYELLKNGERPIKDLLEIKKRVPLSGKENEDTEAGKANGKKYLDKYNPPTNPKPPTPKDGETPPKQEPEPVPIKDAGSLTDGDNIKTKPDTVPPVFKTECKSRENKTFAGIGEEEFKNYLDYCTKDDPEKE